MPPKILSAIGLPYPATLSDDGGAAAAAAEQRVLLLYDDCGAGLRRYIASFGLGAASTEDVLQEVFLALFRHLCLGRSDANLKGWLFRVGHNLALKTRQRSAKRQRAEGSWDENAIEDVIDPSANPEEQLAVARRRERLGDVMRALPERDRQCIHLRAEGLPYRDIAKTLGISLGSVAKSLARAMRRLDAEGVE